ncbi:hypothetical protein BBJ28_00005530 [Nothophytophthora sp. Chile5]|nr:hypothetical protein BBJ28_00005530 [Nothophytophthora sp. Chile5]
MWRQLARRGAAGAAHRAHRIQCVQLAPSTRRADALGTIARVSQRPQQLLLTARGFGSSANDDDGSTAAEDPNRNRMRLCDIELHSLARHPWDDLRRKFGPVKLGKARQALPQVWKLMVDNTATTTASKEEASGAPTPEVVEEFFSAASQCKLSTLQMEIFNYMETHYPNVMDFVMYDEIFRVLSIAKDLKTMLVIFERAVQRYDPARGHPAPEIVYRFGICAAIARDDMEEIQRLVDEMAAYDVDPSVEIKTRVLIAKAKGGDVETVLATSVQLDPHDGNQWHEADVTRVITSLGIVGKPDMAFDFYRRSQIRLSPNLLMVLMLVCRGNKQPKHALAILANRRRFGLKLMSNQYPLLLEILEELDIAGKPGHEMALVLEEMRANNVVFNARTHAIIARNQQHLQGTPFMLTESTSTSASEPSKEAQPRWMETDLPLMRKLLEKRDFAQAATITDAYVRPVSDVGADGRRHEGTGRDATVVPPWLAEMAVEAYTQNAEVDKVRSLLLGFSRVHGKFGHALSRMASLFGGNGELRDNRAAYDVFVAMQFQERAIFRVRDALARFEQFHDADATLLLVKQVVLQIAKALNVIDGANGDVGARRQKAELIGSLKNSGALRFDPVRAVRDGLRILVDMRELGKVVEALDYLESQGVPVRGDDYKTIFRAMGQVNSSRAGVYTADDFMTVWEDMTRRGVAPNKSVLHHVILPLCSKAGKDGADGRKRRQCALLEGYRQASSVREDRYVLSIPCFSELLSAAAESGGVEDVHAVYTAGAKSLDSNMNRKHHNAAYRNEMLQKWKAIRVKKVATEGDAAGALALLREMVSPPSDAVVAVLGAGYQDENHGEEVVHETLAIFRKHNCWLHATEAKRLMHVAQTANSAAIAVQIVHLLEEGGAQEGGDDGDVHWREPPTTAEGVSQMQTLYQEALALCEKAGKVENVALMRRRLASIAAL